MSTKTGNVSPTSGSWAARLTSRNGYNLHGDTDQGGPIGGVEYGQHGRCRHG